jgi:hypothetical protein
VFTLTSSLRSLFVLGNALTCTPSELVPEIAPIPHEFAADGELVLDNRGCPQRDALPKRHAPSCVSLTGQLDATASQVSTQEACGGGRNGSHPIAADVGEFERLRGAIRWLNQIRMPEKDDLHRAGVVTPCRDRIHGTFSSRT